MMMPMMVMMKVVVMVTMMGVNISIDHNTLLWVMWQRGMLLRKVRLVWRDGPRSLSLLEVI